MKVLKFGGTSVGSAERMKEVVRLIIKQRKSDSRSFSDVGDHKFPGSNCRKSIRQKECGSQSTHHPARKEISNRLFLNYFRIFRGKEKCF